jgi:hypothetical protein
MSTYYYIILFSILVLAWPALRPTYISEATAGTATEDNNTAIAIFFMMDNLKSLVAK